MANARAVLDASPCLYAPAPGTRYVRARCRAHRNSRPMTFDIALHDLAGGTGVLLVLGTYGLLQAGRMRADGLLYSVLNLLGALLIGYSLLFSFNLASFVIEVFWALASLWGIRRALRERHARR